MKFKRTLKYSLHTPQSIYFRMVVKVWVLLAKDLNFAEPRQDLSRDEQPWSHMSPKFHAASATSSRRGGVYRTAM